MSYQSRSTAGRAADLTPAEAGQVRTSKERATAIQQYIQGLLPSDLAAEVEVVISNQVPTAAVMPASADALLEDDTAEFDREQAQQLASGVDTDYLVLVTGHEATTDSICLSDQLTADAAHQFGLAFHETLHILKTSFGAVQTLVEEEIEEQYHGFVHELINIIEDGAIEHEARTGDDFTERAGNRLTLIRQMHSQSVAELAAADCEFSFGDAMTKALFDRLIFDTGVTDVLLDESDSRLSFQSEGERDAFTDIHDEILALRDDILALRSDHSDRLYDDDREASIQRAKRLIDFWHDVLKPLIEDGETPQQSQQGQEQEEGQPDAGADDTGQSQSSQPQGDAGNGDTGGEPDTADGSDAGSHPDGSADGNDDTFECPDCDDEFDSEHGRAVHHGQQHPDAEDLDGQLDESESGGDAPDTDSDIDPKDLSLDTDSVDDPFQGIEDHPSVSEEPDPEDVNDPVPEAAPQPTESTDTSRDERQPDADSGDAGDDAPSEDTPSGSGGEGDAESDEQAAETSSGSSAPQAGDTSDESNAGNGSPAGSDAPSGRDEQGEPSGDGVGDSSSDTTSESPASETTTTDSETADLASHTSTSEDSGGDDQQATFGDFGGDSDTDDTDTAAETGPSTEDAETPASEDAEDADTGTESETDRPPETADNSDDGATGDASGDDTTDDGMDFDPSDAGDDQSSGAPGPSPGDSHNGASTLDDSPEGPAASTDDAQTDTSRDDAGSREQSDSPADTDSTEQATPDAPAHDETDLDPADFESDRQRAQRTADTSTIDDHALEDDLQTLENALGETEDTGPTDAGGGDGAGPGSVDELTVLPEPDTGTGADNWGDIERAGETVADTLAKELRLDQQTATRNGLSAGTTVNTKTAHRLNHNDPRTFTETLPGDDKEYFIVFVLDRSGSMSSYGSGPSKIDIATRAVAQFAVACEDLDIDVAVIDFYDDEARYVKPPSVEAEFAQESILTTETGGRTPLADALNLARSVAEADRKESLIISITDDKPNDVDAVETEIKAAYSPTCSLTIATDCEYGNPPAKAETLEAAYDQTTTVFDPAKLDDRIDELASLLGAY